MDAPTALERGRTAYREHRWSDAIAGFDAADRASAATALDLAQLAIAATLVGRFEDCVDWLTRAHEAFLADGDVDGAVRCAAWLGMQFMDVGDRAQAGGWFARAQRLVDEHPDGRPDHGFLLIPEGLAALYRGDGAQAASVFGHAAELARAAKDPDLVALAELGLGQSEIMLGRPAAGLARLDEVMVAVTAGEVSPVPSGIVYCAVLQACRLARAELP